jgi:branched-chain amino acid transport system permease protein
VTFPAVVKPDPLTIAGVPVFPQQVMIVAVVTVTMIAVALVFRYTTAGKSMQATAESQRAAYLVGIRVDRVYLYTWAASAAFAALAGCLAAPLTLLSPDIGGPLLLKAFAATVVGGLGSMTGACAGGLLIGIIESLAGGYIATGVQDVSAFVVIMVVLVVRPHGLFGQHAPRDA